MGAGDGDSQVLKPTISPKVARRGQSPFIKSTAETSVWFGREVIKQDADLPKMQYLTHS